MCVYFFALVGFDRTKLSEKQKKKVIDKKKNRDIFKSQIHPEPSQRFKMECFAKIIKIYGSRKNAPEKNAPRKITP